MLDTRLSCLLSLVNSLIVCQFGCPTSSSTETTSPIAAVPLALATAVAWTSCEPAQGSNDRPYSFLIVSETGVRDPSAKHSGVRRDSYDRTPAYHLHFTYSYSN